MKKISTLFLIVLCICVAAIFVSCGEHTHAWDEGTVITEPTCMYEGTLVRTCECGKTKVVTLDKLAHDYDTDVSYDNAYHYYACMAEGCQSVLQKEEHKWNSGTVTTQPTCDRAGVKTYKCACGATKTENLTKLEHEYDDGKITKKPTCQSEGVKTYTCVCGKTYTEVVAALGSHSFSETLSSDKTHHYYACKVAGCDAIKDKAEHVFVEAEELSVEPTCVSVGERIDTCECGETKSVEIPKLDHVFSEDFHSNDLYHYHYCTNKSCTAVDVKVAHSFGEGVVTKAPVDKMSDGIITYTCSTCGRVVNETLHAFGEWVYDAEKHYRKCTVKGHEEITGDAEAHEWDDGTITVYPTPTNLGKIVYTCECGYKDERPLVYESEAPSGAVNSLAWNELFAEEKYANYTVSAKWYAANGEALSCTIEVAGNKSCIVITNGEEITKVYYFADTEINYVYSYDAENEVWVKNESKTVYTESYFYALLNAEQKFFDFAIDEKNACYSAKNISVGDVNYSKIAYTFENGAIKSVNASVDGTVCFNNQNYAKFELVFNSYGATEVTLPETEVPEIPYS